MLGESLGNPAGIKISSRERERQVHTSSEGDVTGGKHRGGRDIWPGPVAIMETLLEERGREGGGGSGRGELGSELGEERERGRGGKWRRRSSMQMNSSQKP